MVGSIEQDEEGILWLGTNNGLVRLELSGNDRWKVRAFTVRDGLPDNFFNIKASYFRNGTMYFGTSRGLVVLDPDIKYQRAAELDLSITDILIDGRPLADLPNEERRKITPYTAEYTEKLVLPAKYHNFTIKFASLTYINPEQNQYAYRLVGHDNDWVYSDSGSRSAYYSKLKPGNYVFEVRATNENGEWGEIRELPIVVMPPLWATWWAYLIYAVLTVATGAMIIYELQRRITLRNRLYLQELETSKVQELNHVKLQFFTNITHELLTPLTIISASSDELKAQTSGVEGILDTMDINVKRLIRLLQQILEFRKAESGNLKLRVAKGNIAAFVRNLATGFEPLIRKQQLHLSVVCDDSMEGYFDSDKLDKIMFNLLSNAAKYSYKGGYIQVNVNSVPGKRSVRISVKDNGAGIPEERRKSLFNRFYEGDYRQYNTIGTGIGLSLTRDLVVLHRGTIHLNTEFKEGTEFIIEIPITSDDYSGEEITMVAVAEFRDKIVDRDAYESSDEYDSMEVDASAPAILIVEDNEELLSVMERLLRREYRVLQALNGNEALEIIGSEEVDLVVSDVMMPEMDGMELTRRIKTNNEICHIPVILLTAKNTDEDRDEGYTAGADAYLAKPFNLSALHARIKNLLKIRERTANDFKKQFAFEIKGLNYTDMDEKFLSDAIACVERHLDDTEFDITRLVQEMGTSRSTLHKKLKTLTGLNSTGFIRNIRLKTASKIMDENKNVRISELAYMVGFNDPKYFSICFKKEFGMLPTEYAEKFTDELK